MGIKNTYLVKPIQTGECKEWFLYKHYAHRIPNIIHAFGLYCDSGLCGVVSFGSTANINLNEIIPGFKTLELNRLVIEEDHENNTLSFFLSRALKILPTPLSLVSYADSNQFHYGYIYQATNWIYTGESQKADVYLKDGKEYHSKTFSDMFGRRDRKFAEMQGFKVIRKNPKHRYFYFLGTKREKKEMKRKLPFKILSYPKGEPHRYDASYQPTTQMILGF